MPTLHALATNLQLALACEGKVWTLHHVVANTLGMKLSLIDKTQPLV